IIPIIKALRTVGEVQPSSLAKLAPITSPEQPTADSIIESISTCGLVISPTFSNEVMAKIKAINKNGINNQKIHCHDNLARISPVKVGPIAGANIITRAH